MLIISANGLLGCVTKIDDASNSQYYVSLYNYDTTVSEPTTFRYTCAVSHLCLRGQQQLVQFLCLITTVKFALSGNSKLDKTKVFKTIGRLMKVESIAECSLGAFCNNRYCKPIFGLPFECISFISYHRFHPSK